MARYRVDPRKVKVVQMADGTKYRPSADGYVSVSHRHEAEMDRSPARRDWRAEAQVEPVRMVAPGGEGRMCPTCGRSWWPWSLTCGKCSSPLS